MGLVKFELKRLVGRPRRLWADIIKMNLQRDGVGECGMDFIWPRLRLSGELL
jgi:hypothetical protein